MKVLKGYPPNIQAIAAKFPGARGAGVIFAYGDRIYVPSGQKLPVWLVAHEEAHGARQREIGVELWWDNYLASRDFALAEEIIGHRAEYLAFKKSVPMPSMTQTRKMADHIAFKLAGPLYGGLMKHSEALSAIGAYQSIEGRHYYNV